MTYTIREYVKASKLIPKHFQNLTGLRGEKLHEYEVMDLLLGSHDTNPPEDAIAIVWVWTKYAQSERGGWSSTGKHCFLNNNCERIESEYSNVVFNERIDSWLREVKEMFPELS
jgi:hypothetical protein